MNSSQRTRLLILAGLIALIALALMSAGCTAPAQATPTPTRTPRPEATLAPPSTPTLVPPTLVPPTATSVQPTAAPTIDSTATVTPAPAAASDPLPAATQSADQTISSKVVATLPPRQPGVSIFTGLRPADPAVLNRRPLAIKVDNEPEVVPQTGLSKADVVIESSKERCMTRYTAIYQSQDAPRIGSIRSARLVDKELPVIFDAILSFSGAVEPVRQELLKSDIGDHMLEQARTAGAFFRDPNIAIPFNVFASTAGIPYRSQPRRGFSPRARRPEEPAQANSRFRFPPSTLNLNPAGAMMLGAGAGYASSAKYPTSTKRMASS